MDKRRAWLIFIILIVVIIIIAILLVYFLKGTNQAEPEKITTTPKVAKILSIPCLSDGYPDKYNTETYILHYSGFDVSYNEEYEQANWVAYKLTKDKVLNKVAERSDNFTADPNVLSGSATLKDYLGSGYDRGHLAPAADMAWSELSMNESFYMTNMSPQQPGFNRGVWKKLEEKVREWAVNNDSIYIVTGPVLENIDNYIGENRVGIPKYYYKAILDLSPPEYKCIAFLMENKKSSCPVEFFAITIDSLEMFTGYNFFYEIDYYHIDEIEQMVNTSDWD